MKPGRVTVSDPPREATSVATDVPPWAGPRPVIRFPLPGSALGVDGFDGPKPTSGFPVPSRAEIAALYAARGFVCAVGLNVLVLRRIPGRLDAFDDMILAWTGPLTSDDASSEVSGPGSSHDPDLFAARCTADPGEEIRRHPTRPDGTAVIMECQALGAFAVGLHHGEYRCLTPVIPIPVWRFGGVGLAPGRGTSMSVQIHHASISHESVEVGRWSEGCVVLPNPDDWGAFMALVDSVADPRVSVTVVDYAP